LKGLILARRKRLLQQEQRSNLGFEAKLWQAADAMRGSMDAAEYKHVALGLIFLKYISDAFEEQYAKLTAERSKGADPEDPTNTAPLTSSGCRMKPGASSQGECQTADHRPGG